MNVFATRLVLLALFCLPALSAGASSSSYVVCDNGLRCFTQPCPSNSALDLRTGKIMKGVWIDIDGLPAAQKTEDLPNALYAGTVVLRGHIENRTRTFHGKKYTLPFLVASKVERKAKASERRRCFSTG